MTRVRIVMGALAVLALGLVAFAGPGTTSAHFDRNDNSAKHFHSDGTIHVPDDYATIQEAVDAADDKYKTIIVDGGTYNESVVVMKNYLTIKGKHGATVMPPADTATGCNSDPTMGELDGFCVFSPDANPIKGVTITGFTVQGFPATGILAFGAKNFTVSENKLIDNLEYGAAAFSSTGTKMIKNEASGAEEAGIYIGDSENANAFIAWNKVTDNGLGLFFRDSTNGTAVGNIVKNNCIGVFLLETGSPTIDSRWQVMRNWVTDNTKACPPSDEGPALSGGGVIVFGGSKNRITGNVVKGNVPSGPTALQGGIGVFSSICFVGAEPTDNKIAFNWVHDNDPDLASDGTGSDNNFFHNGGADVTPATGPCSGP